MAEKLRSTRKWRIGRMERLTSYKSECKREMICRYEDCDTCEEYCPHMNEDDCLCLQEVLEKLGAYEDLEGQGKLLKPPCAVGDTVYHLCTLKNGELGIIEMIVDCVEPYGAIRKHKGMYEVWNVYAETEYTKEYFKFFDFGKTVFLTKEEAEAALKEQEEG